MNRGFFVIFTVIIFHDVLASANYPERKPELGKYQDFSQNFPLTETWFVVYRNYEEDPVFGTSKCLRFTQTGPEEDGFCPALAEMDGSDPSAAKITLQSSEGYTVLNQINYFPEGQDESLPLYAAFLDPVNECIVLRITYVNEGACCVSVPESKLGKDTTSCDFVHDLLCGPEKYQISDETCKKEG